MNNEYLATDAILRHTNGSIGALTISKFLKISKSVKIKHIQAYRKRHEVTKVPFLIPVYNFSIV